MNRVRTRFAPSPTGFMHIGNLRSGLYAYLFAKKNGGDFVLRIEDTDRTRYVEGAVETVYRTLKIAGIEHDEGPDKDKGYGPYIQSERMGLYKEYADLLVDRGAAYYCFCDEERLSTLKNADGIKHYDGHCRDIPVEEARKRIAAGEPYVVRHKVPHTDGVGKYTDAVYGEISVAYKEMDDIILLKSDGMPTYNFANVVDDHLMEISHVLRGCEYLSSTPQYNLIYEGFGWETPSYAHLPHIMKDAHHKLSKRNGDANFEDFYSKGYLPEAIVNYIALLGWSPEGNEEKLSLKELEEQFTLERINNSPAMFDNDKMKWLNGEYVKALSDEEFLSLASPWLENSAAKNCNLEELAKLLKTRVEILSEIPEKVVFLDDFDDFSLELFNNPKQKSSIEVAASTIGEIIDVFSSTPCVSEDLFAALVALSEKLAIKKNAILWVTRIALTGAQSTPGGATEMAVVLGKEESLRRLNKVRERLNV